MSNGFWGNMWISCFFIATFHQIAVYSLCLGPSWILIHLMLKFIVVFAITIPFLNSYFKTSHVKVYLKPGTDVICRYAISKHLMLKFISRWAGGSLSGKFISKHLMLKFIFIGTLYTALLWNISKHLMLKFIKDVFNA